MSRPLRIHFEGAWYHVMNRGVNHGKIFFTDNHKLAFLNYLNETKRVYGIEIHAYCLMSNHYHLIIHTPRGNISQAMKYLNGNYAKFVNFSMNRDGPLFRGRFKAILISEDDYLIRLSRYIHLNPLTAGMVQTLSSYKWSSYPCYIGIVKSPEWLSTQEIYGRFGSAKFCKLYKEFVELTPDKEIDEFYSNDKYKPVLGSANFCQMIDDHAKAHSLSSADIIGAKNILVPPTLISIVDAVSAYFNIKPLQIYQVSKAINNPARRIAIYICRELGGISLQQIANSMGGVSYKAISNAIQRTKADAQQKRVAINIINILNSDTKTISDMQRENTNGAAAPLPTINQ